MTTRVSRSALLPYSAESVFDIVNDVSKYPEFLPWCSAVEILESNDHEIVAELSVRARGVQQTFTTRNILTPPEKIELQLVAGPFEEFSGSWCFKKLGDDEGCRIELLLNFQLSGVRSLLGASFLGSPFARVFTGAADKMVDAFCERANALLS
ncbi:MAG: type II toxin-antitoxin system RatA family toxin [Pseudomonadales bacterium]